MSLLTRIAVVLGIALLLAAVAATFLPTEPDGVEGCGSWVAPGISDGEYEDLIAEYGDLYDDAEALGVESRVYGGAANLANAKRSCDDALGTRRTVSLLLLGGAVLVPAGVLFVGRRREVQAGAA
jgi:hypothetical protein